MAILDIFKRKKTAPSKPLKRAPAKLKAKKPEAEKPKVEKPKVGKAVPQKKISKLAAKVLKEPHVTEKASDLVAQNQYVFQVWPRSNKSEIKQAVEELYGVNVLKVNIINIPSKQRRLGRITGESGGYKKAIVKIKSGQKIEVLPR